MYYNDQLNFKNEFDLNIALTSFALINIDEFDKTTNSQQIVLKYLLSSADVKFRPPSERPSSNSVATPRLSAPPTNSSPW